LYSEYVVQGIQDAVSAKKKRYTPTTSISRFTREMYVIIKFANILVQKERRMLDLDAVPKMIRTKLYTCLKLVSYMNEGSFHILTCKNLHAGTLKISALSSWAAVVAAG
jgi:hypothetical protein